MLVEFRDLSRESGIKPVLLYIPTKFQIYAKYATPESGWRFLKTVHERRPYEDDSIEALTAVAREVHMPLINLTPDFRRRAGRGELLYHPFDSHWNSAGREAAAAWIARSVDW